MATRDRSVGIGFSNTNVYVLYKRAQAASALAKAQSVAQAAAQPLPQEAKKEEPIAKVFRQDELAELKIQRFQPSTIIKAEPQPQAAAIQPEIQEQLNVELKSLEDLKSNLNRLQDMHGKLRFMLKELEDLVAKKK